MWRWATFSLILIPLLVQGQVWQTGDNSTIQNCKEECKTDSDADRSCWQNSLTFYEQALIIQLRNYISSQIDLDQWYRNHDKKVAQSYDTLTNQIRDQFKAQLQNSPQEVLLEEYVVEIANDLSSRIKTIATSKMENVPLYQCPLDCQEKQHTMQLTFGLSAILNFLLAIAVIPTFIRSIRPDEDEKENKQGRANQAYTE